MCASGGRVFKEILVFVAEDRRFVACECAKKKQEKYRNKRARANDYLQLSERSGARPSQSPAKSEEARGINNKTNDAKQTNKRTKNKMENNRRSHQDQLGDEAQGSKSTSGGCRPASRR